MILAGDNFLEIAEQTRNDSVVVILCYCRGVIIYALFLLYIRAL
jgi:hypothetical protein